MIGKLVEKIKDRLDVAWNGIKAGVKALPGHALESAKFMAMILGAGVVFKDNPVTGMFFPNGTDTQLPEVVSRLGIGLGIGTLVSFVGKTITDPHGLKDKCPPCQPTPANGQQVAMQQPGLSIQPEMPMPTSGLPAAAFARPQERPGQQPMIGG